MQDKTFDKIQNPLKMINILNKLGIKVNILNLIMNIYKTHREQTSCLVVKNSKSSH